MTLRKKLLAAQAPLGVALVFIAIASVLSVGRLGESSERILRDNFRSVLAAQAMIESAERMDSAALFLVAGERARANALTETHRRLFERWLAEQEGNITESGEIDATHRLRDAWTAYDRAFEAFERAPSIERYRRELEPRFSGVKSGAAEILGLNQDAIVRKSDEASRTARRQTQLMTIVSIVALAVGVIASFWLTSRLLRPLDNLSLVARRLGEGDWSVRAAVLTKDEIADVAREFNEMAGRIEAYRKSSLGELLQAQLASQAAIDSIPDPVMVFEVGGTLLSSNEAADGLLRLDRPSVDAGALGRLEPGLRAAVERVRDHVLSGRGAYVPSGFEEAVMVPLPDGERHFLPRATPVYSEEKGVSAVTVILSDITRLHRFDELRNNVVATVAHEFRTPLTSLRMAIHLLIEGAAGEISPKQSDLLGAARDDCDRLQTIVDDLLDLARLRSGTVSLELRPVNPADLVADAIAASRADASREHIQLESQVTPSLDDVVVDPARVQLVFSNLLANAFRHTPENGTVTVVAEPRDGSVWFAVVDTGTGISSEHLPHLFERFYRAPGEKTVGAGLGLSIAREIVDAHGGEIGASSVVGQGSTFWFRLPTASNHRAAENADHESVPSPR